ncbi:succinate dehydrogenase assembly factor 2 [Marinospirillum sp.]|uniref:FAD assembly factor SdhE n=1 Tax=Marinospirillum sp. TaxID=2183934 RepID=UPI00286FB9C3|nr:succinate dehydrogenase assembly factor 2 [Marinospirillum sp.]MDR9467638.1 succinate dehydrogenase assembly factor 2 [Marinospirillum sp.]
MTTNSATPAQETPQSPERKRLYWHSRRGMWELDLLLIPFLEKCYDQLSEDLQADYRRLITLEDQDLFTWLMRREETEDPSLQAIVNQIIEHAENGDRSQFKGL